MSQMDIRRATTERLIYENRHSVPPTRISIGGGVGNAGGITWETDRYFNWEDDGFHPAWIDVQVIGHRFILELPPRSSIVEGVVHPGAASGSGVADIVSDAQVLHWASVGDH